MASCGSVDQALARIEGKLGRIKPIDEKALADRVAAIVLNKPQIKALRGDIDNLKSKQNNLQGALQKAEVALGGLSLFATTRFTSLGNSLDNLRAGQFQLGKKVAQNTKTVFGNKVAVDKLGRTVLNQGRIVTNQNALIKNLRNAFIRLDVKTAGLAGKVAKVGATVATIAGKLLPLFNFAGGVAGFISLVATLKITFPSINSIQAEQVRQGNDISTALGFVSLAVNQARAAEKAANTASKLAQGGQNGADTAISLARQALNAAGNAVSIAGAAGRSAADALNKAANAQRGADVAYSTASDSLKTSRSATNLAQQAKGTATFAVDEITEANKKIAVLDKDVKKAQAKADYVNNEVYAVGILALKADNTANSAHSIGLDAFGGVTRVESQVRYLEPKIQNAESKAQVAYDKSIKTQQDIIVISSVASNADSKATSSLNQISQVRPISEQALTKAFLAYNVGSVAETTATNAFQATQLTATSLTTTNLRVTKLENRPLNITMQNQTRNQLQNNQTLTAPQVVQIKNIIKENAPPMDAATKKKIDEIHAETKGSKDVLTIVKSTLQNIADQINRAIRQINQLQANINIFINQVNTYIQQLFKFVSDVHRDVKTTLNQVIAVAAILTALRPVILSMASRVIGLVASLGRLINWLVVDRVLNIFNFVINLHNALMLSNQLKETLLTMLSSVGNATGLLQTAEGDNVDLTTLFNKSIEQLIIAVIGADNYGGLRAAWKKYNRIYQAGANVINAMQSMFSSLGEAVEATGEYVARIGNALHAAGAVAENAYQWFSEKINAKSSRFLRFAVATGASIAVFSAINEIAESVVEAQEAKEELDKATDAFKKELKDSKRLDKIENTAIKAEADAARLAATQDPTGQDEVGLLSFLTDL